MNRIIKTAVAIAVLSLTGAAGVASAETVEARMAVHVGDLNIHSQDGATIALRRIQNAAKQFCGPQSRDLQTTFAHQRCVTAMTGKAVAKLDAPMVTALYGGSPSIQLAQAQTSTR